MERLALRKLLAWQASAQRKPLILSGARQVGKTWLLKEFGRRTYDHVAYLNFDENPELREFFTGSLDPHRIVPMLSMVTNQPILPHKTLIFFDEIQDCPEVINSLKYFCECAPEYHVVCAGSLLGVTLARPAAFPVGKTDFLQLHPMSFQEFLLATGSASLAAVLDSVSKIAPLPEAVCSALTEKLKMYFITGGMPEVISVWTKTQDAAQVQSTLFNIISACERDFMKHPNVKEYPRISLIWNSLPSQLARENKKFLYRALKEGARAREYADALEWLTGAGVVLKVQRLSVPRLPLSAYADLNAFKLYLNDVGMLRRLARLDPAAFREGSRLFTEFRGALTENYVLQSLLPQLDVTPYYWSKLNPSYEVDFIIQRKNTVIPVEVKADTSVRSASLKKYNEMFSAQTPLRVRFSQQNLQLADGLLNIPLFMADQAGRLIGMALHDDD